ncbi:MAG: crosslink repair DNA glycosylase YcaQ family protein [Caldilineaceae bacterium]
MRTISPQTARRLAVSAQRLTGPRPKPNVEGMLELFRDLRCVQIDPIRAVERTELLVLWSRLGKFDPAVLEQLLWQDKSLFEYWAHCASIVLTEDYPIFRHQMARYIEKYPQDQAWIEANGAQRDHIYERLRTAGAQSTSDFDDLIERAWQSSGWNSNRNVGMVLMFLWLSGELAVAGRNGNKKLWHLAEEWLPHWTPRHEMEPEALTYAAAQHALRSLGAGSARHIRQHFIRSKYPHLEQVLKRLIKEGKVEPLQVVEKGQPWKDTWYIHTDQLSLLDQIEAGAWRGRTVLLSPFDNLICDRVRTEQLFDFYYRIEIYVPKAKRQFGYYVLPILHGDRLIGRVDSRMERKEGRYFVDNIYAEEGAPMTKKAGRELGQTLRNLASFLGAEEVVYGQNIPQSWRGEF